MVSPKKDARDRVQLCAQAIALEEMLGIGLTEGAMYYHEIGRRQKILFDQALRAETIATAREMHRIFQSGETPRAIVGKNCRLCSLKDICIPRLTQRKVNVANYIQHFLSEEV